MGFPKYFFRVILAWYLFLILSFFTVISIVLTGEIPIRAPVFLAFLLLVILYSPPIVFFLKLSRDEILPPGMRLMIGMFGGLSLGLLTIPYLLFAPSMMLYLEEALEFPFPIYAFLILVSILLFGAIHSLKNPEDGVLSMLGKPLLMWEAIVATIIVSVLIGSLTGLLDSSRIAYLLFPLTWIPALSKLNALQNTMFSISGFHRPGASNQLTHPLLLFCKD